MKYLEKHPMIMIAVGIMGISLSAIFVRYSQAPSVVTAAYRLLWTVALMAPVVFFKPRRKELFSTDKRQRFSAPSAVSFLPCILYSGLNLCATPL